MWEFATESKPIAIKEYDCQAWPWIDNEGCYPDDFTEEEQAIIENARNEGFKILPGTQYLRIDGKWEGEFTTYRARLDIQKICDDHELQEY